MEYTYYPFTADSHLHILEMKQKGLDVDSLLDHAFANGLSCLMDASVDEKYFNERASYQSRYEGIYLSAGIHPNSTTDISMQLDSVKSQIDSGLVSAIGETGLDFHWDTIPATKQKEMFSGHIQLSREYGLPLIVHNRLADKEIFEILRSEKAEMGVIHCFSSDFHFASKFVDLGFFISFAGNITYKKSEEIREAASKVPFDRILVETDAPYLSPQKMRGKLNHPGHICHTIDCIADIFNRGADETAHQTYENFLRLFSSERTKSYYES